MSLTANAEAAEWLAQPVSRVLPELRPVVALRGPGKSQTVADVLLH